MIDIYSLLGISEDRLSNYHLQANTVADHQTEKVIVANVRRLKQIEERMITGSQIKVTLKTVDDVLQKVTNFAYKPDHSEEEWSSYDLRIISYYLMKLQGDDRAHDYGLELLDRNWKPLFFNGLIYYVLNGWNLMRTNYRDKVCQLIVKRLKLYNENNKKYLLLKDHANFFEENGPLRMASLLKAKNMNLEEAPRIIGYKSSMLSLSFFSDVIVNYMKESHFENPDKLEEIFAKHDLDRTKKLVFANLVVTADKGGNPFEQNQLSKFANRILGDISKSVTWTPFTGATDSDVSKLRYAKDLVNQWYIRKVIEVFFEVCVQDAARKRFWLQYATDGYINDFRIAGSTLVRQKMQNDDRISTLFSRYFINTNSKSSQTAALILFMKNKVLVEFSDTGALYAYNKDNEVIGFLYKGRNSIASVSDLKLTYLSNIVDEDYYSYYFRDEGRLRHSGEWQRRLRNWISRYVLNAEDNVVSLKDDDVFKAQPLPAQSPAPAFLEENEIREDNIIKHESISSSPKPQLNLFGDTYESEKHVAIKIASKMILGRFRVVGNSRGFYINIGKRFVHIKDLDNKEYPSGNIWVKHPKYGWFNIVHFDCGVTTNVGFVKIEGNKLLYKTVESQTFYKTIDL